nr:hypothetical protein [Secundilactobacillus collinoides]
MTSDDDVSKSVGEYIQSAIQQNLKGITVSLKTVPLNNEIAAMEKGSFELASMGWTSDFKDPLDFLNKASITNAINFGRFHSAAYEKLIKIITDDKQSESARYTTMQAAAKMLAKNQGFTPLYQSTKATLISSKVAGVQPTLLRDTLYRYAYWK